VLVTGPDIIFFWVARMIMAGLEFMGPEKASLSSEEIRARVPFRNVYFTGIIRDAQGRKMSKSLGNSPDPLDLIAQYGADGLRFSILNLAPLGQDIRFSEDSVAQGRNFCNKIWNACRFRQMSGSSEPSHCVDAVLRRLDPASLSDVDLAMIGRLLETMEQVRGAMDQYGFTQVTQQLHAFFWNDFCDWYVEASKPRLKLPEQRQTCLAVQDLVIRQFLLMLHPVCPFITEELWHLMDFGPEHQFIEGVIPEQAAQLRQLLSNASVPETASATRSITALRESLSQIRALKAEFGVGANRNVGLIFITADEPAKAVVEAHRDTLMALAGLGVLDLSVQAPQSMPSAVTPLGSVFLDLSGAVDLPKERLRLQKEIDRINGIMRGVEGKLGNGRFVEQAPASVVEGARAQLEENRQKRDQLTEMLAQLGA
jgi:valyl-tRNA synthetase